MNIFKLSYRNMISRPLSTALCLVLLTLGAGMISLLIHVNNHVQQQMENNLRGIDMVVGAKGSPLQLILSAIYHIDAPTGNVTLHEVEQLQENRLVASCIPLAYGDSYQGYRIVGTTYDYPKLYDASITSGRLWERPLEVVIGTKVATHQALTVGDTFVSSHGLTKHGESHDKHHYTVVGILKHTHSVLDQLILTGTESIWKVHDHAGDTKQPPSNSEGIHAHEANEKRLLESEHEREITAALIQFRNPMAIVRLPRMVNENTNMQAAVPRYEIDRLFDLMGIGIDTLGVIALVIMGVSGFSVFISLYLALQDRQYEMALMRAYGSTRWQLAWLVLQEGLLLTLTGFLLGVFSSRIGLWFLSVVLESDFHYSFSGGIWLRKEWWLLLATLMIGLIASLLPAFRVFTINISRLLADG